MIFLSGLNDSANNQNLVLQKNNLQKRKIIKQLYLSGAMTNTDLGMFVKLSTPKIISLLNELKDEGLIEELGQGNSSGGRRPNLYGNKEDIFYIVGISIGIYTTSISIFNARNQTILENQNLSVQISKGIEMVDQLVTFTKELIAKANIPIGKVLGVGIEMPGMLDSETGINKTYLVSEIPVADLFKQKLGLEVIIENDAKTRAFAELRFGAAQERHNVLVVHLDWGIGLGILVNGKLYKGRDGFSGEFGHLPMVEDGMLCKCGKQGCLETIASGAAVVRLASEGMLAGRSAFLSQLTGNSPDLIDLGTVVGAASRGDQFSVTMLSGIGHQLGKGLAFLIQIFNPEMIILGGQLANASQFICPQIQQAIHIYCNPELSNELEIKVSELGPNAGIQGVAALMLEQVLERKSNN